MKVFERIHAQDRVRELARHIGDTSSDDLDIFGAHARAEGSEGQVSALLSIASIAVLLGAFAFFGNRP